MDWIYSILKSLNNRELSIFIWASIFVIVTLSIKNVRASIWSMLKALFNKWLLLIYFFLITYSFLEVFILKSLGFWEVRLAKETLFWFFGVGLLMTFKLNTIKSSIFFNDLLKETFKWTIILEFIVGFKSFNLAIELVLIPIVTLAFILQSRSFSVDGEEKVQGCLKTFLYTTNLIIITLSLIFTVVYYEEFFTVIKLKGFLLPILLTLLFFPYLYFSALAMNYQTLFRRLTILSYDKKFMEGVKRSVFKVAKFNLNKLNRISKNFSKRDLLDNSDTLDYVSEIAKK